MSDDMMPIKTTKRRTRSASSIGIQGSNVVPLRQVSPAIDLDTIECLERLLEEARSGQVIGIAYAAMYQRRSYVVDAAGEAHRNPTWSLGMVEALRRFILKKLNISDD